MLLQKNKINSKCKINYFLIVKPAVQIVVHGGPEALQLIRLTLESSAMPVILVKGTGGAADLLIKAHQKYDEHSDNLGSIAAELSQEIEKAFLNFSDDSQVILKELLQCAKGKKNVCLLFLSLFL